MLIDLSEFTYAGVMARGTLSEYILVAVMIPKEEKRLRLEDIHQKITH